MSDFMAEFDESIRRERVFNFWRQHGSKIISIILAIIIGTAFVSGYKSWDRHVKTKNTNILIETLNKDSAAEDIYSETDKMSANHSAIADLTAAASFQSDGDADKAKELLVRVIANKSVHPDLRDLAIITLYKSFPPTDDEAKNIPSLERLITSGSPWAYMAEFILARQAYDSGDLAKASEHLDRILQDQNIPQTTLNRARALKHVWQTSTQ